MYNTSTESEIEIETNVNGYSLRNKIKHSFSKSKYI